MQDLHTENNYWWKTLKKIYNRKIFCFYELEDLILRWQYYSNFSIDSIKSLSKFKFFGRNWQVYPKINIEMEETQNIQNNPEKVEQNFTTCTSKF